MTDTQITTNILSSLSVNEKKVLGFILIRGERRTTRTSERRTTRSDRTASVYKVCPCEH